MWLAHLGNGASVTAVKGGKSVDTSMGYTPLAGLVMGTRSGDIDPSALTTILTRDPEIDAERLDTILNKESGLLALAGSNDMPGKVVGVCGSRAMSVRSWLWI